jgi:hypothetical protein
MKNNAGTEVILEAPSPRKRYEPDVLKVTEQDGTVTYRHPDSKEVISVYTSNIIGVYEDALSRFKTIADLMLSEDDSDKAIQYGVILGALIRDAELWIENLSDVVFDQIGRIEIVCVCRGNHPYEAYRVIDACIDEEA